MQLQVRTQLRVDSLELQLWARNVSTAQGRYIFHPEFYRRHEHFDHRPEVSSRGHGRGANPNPTGGKNLDLRCRAQRLIFSVDF